MKHLAKVFLAQIFSKYISNAQDINHITQDYSYTHKKIQGQGEDEIENFQRIKFSKDTCCNLAVN